MKLYLDSGYFNFKEVAALGLPFNIIIGGRGTGKTFGALKWSLESGHKFMYVRRIQDQVDKLKAPGYSPLEALNIKLGTEISVKSTAKGVIGVFSDDGENVGSIVALSTFANIRGFNGADIDYIIFDEFIPQSTEAPIRDELDALANMYESVNRQRELEGQPPVQMFLLSNSNTLKSRILAGLKLILKIDQMQKNKKAFMIDNARGLSVFLLDESPVSKAKADTALYKLMGSSAYTDMALGNDFGWDTGSRKQSRSLKGYQAIFTIGELTAYKNKNEYYISSHESGSPARYRISDSDIRRCKRDFLLLFCEWLNNKVVFENVEVEILFNTIFDLD